MEGPTPVSALIHAATMVTAGVYLIIRCSFLFEHSYFSLLLVVFIGGLTAFYGAITGVAQTDIKRVIAYSTCSQLGYMILVAGLSGYKYSLYHLSTHAVFKGLLFLSAGAILHALIDEQDSRKLGGNLKQIPYVYIVFVIGSFSLMGIPFLAGFYSKDLIIEYALSRGDFLGSWGFWLASIAAFFTSFYSCRLLILSFSRVKNASVTVYSTHVPLQFISTPLILLAYFSVFSGFLLKEIFVGFGTPFFVSSIFIFPVHDIIVDTEFYFSFLKFLPIIFSFIACFFVCFLQNIPLFKILNLLKTSISDSFDAIRIIFKRPNIDYKYPPRTRVWL